VLSSPFSLSRRPAEATANFQPKDKAARLRPLDATYQM